MRGRAMSSIAESDDWRYILHVRAFSLDTRNAMLTVTYRS